MKKSPTEDLNKNMKFTFRRKYILSSLIYLFFLLFGSIGIIVMTNLYPESRNELMTGYISSSFANFVSFALIFFLVDFLYKNQIKELDNKIDELKQLVLKEKES